MLHPYFCTNSKNSTASSVGGYWLEDQRFLWGSHVLMALNIKTNVSWYVTPYIPVHTCRRIWGLISVRGHRAFCYDVTTVTAALFVYDAGVEAYTRPHGVTLYRSSDFGTVNNFVHGQIKRGYDPSPIQRVPTVLSPRVRWLICGDDGLLQCKDDVMNAWSLAPLTQRLMACCRNTGTAVTNTRCTQRTPIN